MEKEAIAVTIIVVFFVAFFMIGCIEKDVPVVAPTDNTVFTNVLASTIGDIAHQVENIEVAKDNGDFVTAKNGLAAFDISIERYVTKFEEMNVAENTIPCKTAVKRFLEELQTLSICIDAYLENPTVDMWAQYGMQWENVMNQMEIAKMLNENI